MGFKKPTWSTISYGYCIIERDAYEYGHHHLASGLTTCDTMTQAARLTKETGIFLLTTKELLFYNYISYVLFQGF
jgi:hypothetical protein